MFVCLFVFSFASSALWERNDRFSENTPIVSVENFLAAIIIDVRVTGNNISFTLNNTSLMGHLCVNGVFFEGAICPSHTNQNLFKGIVKCAEPGKCDILLVSRILWHTLTPSLKE